MEVPIASPLVDSQFGGTHKTTQLQISLSVGPLMVATLLISSNTNLVCRDRYQRPAFFHMWSQNSWTSFTEHVVTRLTIWKPDSSSYLGKLVVSRTNGTPMTSCSFPLPIDNVSWKFLQNSTKIIIINNHGEASSKILLDMDTKTEANNLLAFLQQYSALARQNIAQDIDTSILIPTATRASDISVSMDETMANFDDPSTSILDASTASFSDFMFGQNINDGTVLNDLASDESALRQSLGQREDTMNFANSDKGTNPFDSIPQSDFNVPSLMNMAFGAPTIDTTQMEARLTVTEEPAASHHPSLSAYYERLNDAWSQWDHMTQAEQALWTPEE